MSHLERAAGAGLAMLAVFFVLSVKSEAGAQIADAGGDGTNFLDSAATDAAGNVFVAEGVSDNVFRIMAPDLPVPARVHLLKPTKLSKIVSKPAEKGAKFAIPDPGGDSDPTIEGADVTWCHLGVPDACQTFSLPAGGWTGLGNPPGSKGYKYKGGGTFADPCRSVLLKEKVIKAVCKQEDLETPIGTGGVGWELKSGDRRYCAESSTATNADVKKDDGKLWKAINAGAPAVCPLGCGNGIITGDEVCDGAAGCEAGQSCLDCGSCQDICGNGIITGDEVCDGAAGCEPGEGCVECGSCEDICGNGIVTGAEVCEEGTCGVGFECIDCGACVELPRCCSVNTGIGNVCHHVPDGSTCQGTLGPPGSTCEGGTCVPAGQEPEPFGSGCCLIDELPVLGDTTGCASGSDENLADVCTNLGGSLVRNSLCQMDGSCTPAGCPCDFDGFAEVASGTGQFPDGGACTPAWSDGLLGGREWGLNLLPVAALGFSTDGSSCRTYWYARDIFTPDATLETQFDISVALASVEELTACENKFDEIVGSHCEMQTPTCDCANVFMRAHVVYDQAAGASGIPMDVCIQSDFEATALNTGGSGAPAIQLVADKFAGCHAAVDSSGEDLFRQYFPELVHPKACVDWVSSACDS